MIDDSSKPALASRPTIRDVARLAKVSIGTVSAVINNSGRPVAADTREHVLRCIAELNFEPNNAARSLKHQRISSIGFIVPDLGNAFFADVAEGIQGVLDNVDCLLVLCMTWSDTQREEYYAQVLRTQRLNGVIYLSGTGLPSPSLISLAKQGSVVFVDECLPGIDVPFISSQNLIGARTLAQYVLGQGHRRLAIVGGPRGLWTSEQRQAGFREAFAGANIVPDSVPVFRGDYTEASGRRAAGEIIGLSPIERPTAVLCANDLMAIGFIRRCRELDIAVPEQISVTGFDDIPEARLLSPELTTVRQPGNDMGRAAAALLLQRIGALAEQPGQCDFPTELCIRHSVGPGPAE
ncbi:LacI family DNA-binding transcriptional regulator [Acerihabitans arboris]|uniref:LacI family DNA-binding transcriptional regulator n=1 Tax=Acerihabitans arboris TaxID=2691583 RepID=A0A845SKX7_9GAMM|nr:LacI family DNA-binding transcriptional regulator [Acerihabitans arboris]NDL64042.1 LacI family DNA-binding transcriptional regulator [Acerihabitans arboris]